jgi:hypothetical protein
MVAAHFDLRITRHLRQLWWAAAGGRDLAK